MYRTQSIKYCSDIDRSRKMNSASIGLAECEPEDEMAEMVYKRADQLMYDEKLRFKEKYNIPKDERT